MKRKLLVAAGGLTLAAGLGAVALLQPHAADASPGELTGFTTGGAAYKSLGPIAISPAGVVYIADDQSGAVVGVGVREAKASGPRMAAKEAGASIARMMGANASGIEVRGIAVHPLSGASFVTVRKTEGADSNAADPANYALFRIGRDGAVSAVDIAAQPGRRVELQAKAAYGVREGKPYVIGDLVCTGDRLLVPALSTEQFSSNLHSLPLPLGTREAERFATSIYHVSHGKQETASPIQTLTLYRDASNNPILVAAYVCTPLVRIKLEDLKPGATVTGVTVAELGSGNRPMEMIAYGKPGAQSLLVDNSSFGKLRVAPSIVMETEAVDKQTKADRGRRGATDIAGIEPLPHLKDAKVYAPDGDGIVVVRTNDSGFGIESMPAP